MRHFPQVTPQQRQAMRYCESLGANPFQEVWGYLQYFDGGIEMRRWMKLPRWQFYIGAVVEKDK